MLGHSTPHSNTHATRYLIHCGDGRGEVPTEELPVSATVALMDRARVDKALISAWEAPRNTMISNEDVAGFVAEAPDRLDWCGVGRYQQAHGCDARGEALR